MKTKRNRPIEPEGSAGPGRLRRIVNQSVVPIQLDRPALHPRFSKFGPIRRSADLLRYSVLKAEYWLSPAGALREWIRLNVKLWLIVGIPTLLLTPLITMLFASAERWSALMARIFINLAHVPAWLGTGILGITTILFLLRLLFGR